MKSNTTHGGGKMVRSDHGAQLRFLTLALLAILLLSACAVAPTPTPTLSPTEAAFPVTVTDAAGRTVKLEKQPTRIISLAPSTTEILFALGLGDKVVGVDAFSNYPPEAKGKTQVGSFSQIDLEKVVGSQPDLVLAASLHAKGVVPELERRNIPVAVIEAKDIQDVFTKIELIGQMTGTRKEATALAGSLRKKLDEITAKVKMAKSLPRVYWELDNTLFSVGPGSFLDDVIAKAGGVNIASDAKTPYPQLSNETIVLKDPEVIILADTPYGETAAQVMARPGWATISAVKNKRIVEDRASLMLWSGLLGPCTLICSNDPVLY